ncbi:MAG TPA: hypothetical protein VI197_01935 [Polyangiaceae bacterium]
MKLVALEVLRFGCVKRAKLELSPQLNVLYGPNDIGKSTLVHAMRAALLLPHTSVAYRDFVPWQEPDATPEVALTLEVTEDGFPRYYRVRKCFGDSTHLAWSNDNRAYSDDTRKAREVDEKLRQLLQWGVPAAGNSRGMPESFLAKVLMASQPEVTGILDAALADDKDPSGKNRIMTAMAAMLEDPLFKKVLDRATRRVSLAYTNKGKESKRKDSPWLELRAKINEADDEVRRLETLRNQSVAAIAKVRVLEDEVLEAEAVVKGAEKRRNELTARWQRQAALQGEQARLDATQAEVQQQTEKVDAVQKAREALTEVEVALIAKQARVNEAKVAVVAARTVATQAEQRVKQLESADAAREVELRKSQLREQQTRLQAEMATQTRAGERAQAVGKAHEETTALERRAKELGAEVGAHEAAFQARQRDSDQARAEHDQARTLARYFRYRDSVAQLEAAEAAEREAVVERLRAEEANQRADQLEVELAARQLPDAAHLARLRTLYRELEVGQAALDLGLTAVVTPDAPPLEIEVTADEAVRKENLFSVGRFSARESLTLKLPGATVSLTAAAAAQVQELRTRWKESGEPVLKAAGLSTLAELEAAMSAADERRGECPRLRSAAKDHDVAATKLTAHAARAVTLRQTVEEARRALLGADLNELEQQAAKCPSEADAARTEHAVERRRTELDAAVAEARGLLQDGQAQLSAKRTQLAGAQQAYKDAAAAVEGDWHSTLTQVMEVLSRLKAEKADVEAQLEQLASSHNEELGVAQNALNAANAALDIATKDEEDAEQAVNACERERASQRARQELLEAAAQGIDVEAARKVFRELEQAFSTAQTAFLAGGPMLTEDDLTLASAELDRAQVALRQKSNECLLARGGLMEVGGNVVEEELGDAEAALEQRKLELRELEIEYRAWQLLQTTLRDAEESETTHLGEKLGGPLRTRFADLTRGRYTHVDVGTDLKTQGFTLAGDLRPVTALSAGTQEQLSTLFRLCLAEALQTAVVLDDHLSQTDSQKMQWFRDALDEVAQKAQVVVISCWPEHYKLPAGKVDTARKIDAEAVVERY